MEKIALIQSETNAEISYAIYHDSNGYSCDCKSFFYSSQKIKGFQCKHIKSHLEGLIA